MLDLNWAKDGVLANDRRKRIEDALTNMTPPQRRRAERFAAAQASNRGMFQEDPLGIAENAIQFVLEVWDYPGSDAEGDPAENWCRGELKDGGRCTLDAERDGLCKRHWRQANSGGA